MPQADVFVSYSHKDKRWLDRLVTMLRPYVQRNGISLWNDRDIQPGSRWRGAIAEGLNRARVALLLVSPDFLASDFIQQQELPALLAA